MRTLLDACHWHATPELRGENAGFFYTFIAARVPYQDLGSTVTLDESSDDMLFWGIDIESLWTEDTEAENSGYYTVPDEIELTAKAVFKDGATQEIPVTIHFDDITGAWQPGGK